MEPEVPAADHQGLIKVDQFMEALEAQTVAMEDMLIIIALHMEPSAPDREQQPVNGEVHRELYMQEVAAVRLLELCKMVPDPVDQAAEEKVVL